mmetsp:Transcript_34619/g.60874  ORF Transcript_34619/g.60874 Transcript_34619/m.60874 type:complete len:276 (+) Transcript_34619:7-834(+)
MADQGKTMQVTPKISYSFLNNSYNLFRTSLATGRTSRVKVRSMNFSEECSFREVSKGKLVITYGKASSRPGNRDLPINHTEYIDTQRDYAVVELPSMSFLRLKHDSVYTSGYLYIIGGIDAEDADCLVETCERLKVETGDWESLDDKLPIACFNLSATECSDSVYVIGGTSYPASSLDIIQRLNLDSLVWSILEVRLPIAGSSILCFRDGSKVIYFILDSKLFSFNTPSLEIEYLKPMPLDLRAESVACYYSKGFVYASFKESNTTRFKLGDLTQ